MKDIDYFHESDLDYKNIEYFYQSLPSHLQRAFKRGNCARICTGNVLQGYRGPDYMCNNGSGDSSAIGSTHGVQEISFRWAARKDLNFIPLVGSIVYIGVRAAQSDLNETNFCSLFFDERTGECLSHSKDEAADKLNDKGLELFNQKQYSDAEEYFNNAYHLCSSGYRDEQTFKQNRDNAKNEFDALNLNNQGNKLLNNRNYSESKAKYQEAFNKSNVSRQLYRENIEKVQAEIDAINFNNQGNGLFSEGRYREALTKYQEAYDKSSLDYKQYKENIKKAQEEITAQNFNNEGDQVFAQGKYAEAKAKYQEAYNKSAVAFGDYEENINKAQLEIDAQKLNYQGHELFNQGRYNEAIIKYQEANDYSKFASHLYEQNIKKAQAELEAKSLNKEGEELLRQGKCREALDKFQRACNKSIINKNKYKANISRAQEAQSEIDADNLNDRGHNLFSQAKYENALTTYKIAHNKTKVNKKKFEKNIKKAEIEVSAEGFNYLGDNFFDEKSYKSAVYYYELAYEKSEIPSQKNVYAKNKLKVEKELLSLIESLWNKAWEAENDMKTDRSREAQRTFQQVLNNSKKYSEILPKNLKLKQYQTIASLKLEGNELCNKGLELQQSGQHLLQEAQQLEQQGNYQLAETKFKEAQNKFLSAKKKFQKGSNSDERFEACVEFVSEQLEEIHEALQITTNNTLSQGVHGLTVRTTENNQEDSDIENHQTRNIIFNQII